MQSFKEKSARAMFFRRAMTGALALGMIFIFIFIGGAPFIADTGLSDFIFGKVWRPTRSVPLYGILPMIAGTRQITFYRAVMGLPSGLLCRVYLDRYCPPCIAPAAQAAVDLLAGLPSIVYGFFGISVIVPAVGKNSILAADIILGIMILPTMVSTRLSSLKASPRAYYEGALALGATKEQALFKVVLKSGKVISGVAAAAVLALGRRIGETTAVMMVAGNQPRMTFNPFEGIRTMTANIALEVAEAAGTHRQSLIATGLVLLVTVTLINRAFYCLKGRSVKDE